MADIESDEQIQIKQRRDKLNELREQGVAFPTDFRRNVVAGELHAEYGEKSKEELDAEPVRVKIAGRMMTRRIMGKAAFCHVQDMSVIDESLAAIAGKIPRHRRPGNQIPSALPGFDYERERTENLRRPL
jgi:lysyl-tRNA synthetase class II